MPDFVKQALKTQGFDPGEIDGAYGCNTKSALKEFQNSRSLAEGGITLETLRALGLY